MKKIVRLTESELIKMVKQVIQEQGVTDFESNIEECFEIIPRFYFDMTTGDESNWDGGDLWFWNKNEIPELDDKDAYNRFIKHVKDAVGYNHDGNGGMYNPEMILNEDCFDYDNPPSWKELLPYIEQMYYDTIKKKQLESQIQSLDSDKDAMGLAKQMFAKKSKDNLVSFINRFYKKHNLDIQLPIRRRLSDYTLVTYIKNAITEEPPTDFGDPYDYADYILEKVIEDNYSDIILDYWGDVIGFDF